MRISKKLSALSAAVVVSIAVAACGGGNSVPKGSVANVAGNLISLRAFNHWEYIAAKDQAAQSPGTPVIVPNDPPNFEGCLTQIKQQLPSLAKTSPVVLKADCQKVFDQFKTEVMGFLIEGYWYQALAHKDGIRITDAQVQTAFNAIKKKNFAKAGSLQTYLKSTGETMADLMFQVRINTLYSKLLKREQKPINAAAIQSYYNAHKSQFGTKEYANLHLIRTKTQASAQAAYNALKSGQSWNAVAKQYAADASAKANGGLLNNVAAGQEENAVNSAIFSSKVNQVVGPIKGQFGYYVIDVLKVVPAIQQSLAKATPEIKSLIQSQSQQTAATSVNKKAKAAYGKQTLCAKTYSVPDCNGYVAPKTTATTTTTPATTPATTPTPGSTGTATTGGSSTATTTPGSTSTTKSSTSTATTGTSTSKG